MPDSLVGVRTGTGRNRPRRARRAPDTAAPLRILVFRIGELGDTLVALPAFWAIRRRFPDAHLCLLSNHPEAAQGVRTESILPARGLFDEFRHYPSALAGAPWSAALHLLQQLRAGRFDLLIYLSPRQRAPWQVRRDLLFFRAAGIRRILGHIGVLPDGSTAAADHEADHLLSRLRMADISTPSESSFQGMDLRLEPGERARVRAWLAAQLIPAGRPLVAFGPGTRRPSKRWPEERYRAVGERLCQEWDAHPLVVGGPEDEAAGRRLLRQWGRGCNAAGVLNVREAAAALEQCALYVGNDSGAMHLAAAVGTPCVAVFSAQDWPGKWHPYGTGHTVLRREVACQGCRLAVCAAEGMRCLLEIGVEEVVEACAAKLREAGALSLQPAGTPGRVPEPS